MTVGVVVRTDVRSGSGDQLRAPGSQLFTVGLTEHGRTGTPVRVENMTEFAREFGGRVSYGYLTDELAAYFAEGGTRAYVLRVVGPSATKGSITLDDRADVPDDTLTLEAVSAGAWSGDLKATVQAGTLANTVDLILTLKEGERDQQRETYRNHATVASLVSAINGRSKWVTAIDEGSNESGVTALPAVMSATALSAGDDDRANVTFTHLTDALDLFLDTLGPGVVTIPGYSAGDIGAAVADHCDNFGRVAYLHGDIDDDLDTVSADAVSISAEPGSDAIGVIYPWVKIPDPEDTGTITVPPTGFAAGLRAKAHQVIGPWRAPAGDDFPSRYIVGVADELTRTEINEANDGYVIPVMAKSVTKFELYGYRTPSPDEENFYHLTGRDALNTMAWEAYLALQPFVFRPIDGRGKLVKGIESVLEGIGMRYKAAGGVYPRLNEDGDEIDPGYSVSVTAVPEERRVDCVLAARISETAELITVSVLKVAATAAV